MRTPPANQFLCRAYLCQAQLLAPNSAEDPVSSNSFSGSLFLIQYQL